MGLLLGLRHIMSILLTFVWITDSVAITTINSTLNPCFHFVTSVESVKIQGRLICCLKLLLTVSTVSIIYTKFAFEMMIPLSIALYLILLKILIRTLTCCFWLVFSTWMGWYRWMMMFVTEHWNSVCTSLPVSSNLSRHSYLNPLHYSQFSY